MNSIECKSETQENDSIQETEETEEIEAEGAKKTEKKQKRNGQICTDPMCIKGASFNFPNKKKRLFC
ncbi:MAG: hypothetical protein CL916_03625, partial [Deltaproteobacteria bacterium]|nr:hypothetical protein [Deltaproteobacteria bacterium]